MFQPGNVPNRVGVMIVGLAGKKGSSFWALAKLKQEPIIGSIIQCAEICTYQQQSDCQTLSSKLKSVKSFSQLDDIKAISGWDIKATSLIEALQSHRIVDPKSVAMLSRHHPEMYCPIQTGISMSSCRSGPTEMKAHTTGSVAKDISRVRSDIDTFAAKNDLDFVIVMYCGPSELLECPPTQEEFVNMVINDIPSYKSRMYSSQIYALAAAFSDVNACFVNCANHDPIIPCIHEQFKNVSRLAVGNGLRKYDHLMKTCMTDALVANALPTESPGSISMLGVAQSAATTTTTSSKKRAYPWTYSLSNDIITSTNQYCMSLPFDKRMDVFVNLICPKTSIVLGAMFDVIVGTVILSSTLVYKDPNSLGKPLSSNKANRILACLFERPQRGKTRLLWHENRDILIGALVEICGERPETLRHHAIVSKPWQ